MPKPLGRGPENGVRQAVRPGYLAICLIPCLIACSGKREPPPEPPPARAEAAHVLPIILETGSPPTTPIVTRRQNFVEILHGTRVSDPYRWLENGNDPEVRAWVNEQNELTRGTLDRIPARASLRHRLEQLLEIGEISLPSVRRTASGQLRYFFTRRTGKQNQPVLFARDGLRGKDRVLVDPNALNAQGTTALDWYFASRDGKLVAYGLSEGGSEESTLYVRNLQKAMNLPDVIPRTRAASVCWMPDGRRFFYSRYPERGSVPEGEERYHRSIYEHTLGQDPGRDRLIFGKGRRLTDYPNCAISPNGQWLLIRVHKSWNESELFLANTRSNPLRFSLLAGGEPHLYDAIVRDDFIYVHTNEAAPRFALYRVDAKNPERSNWQLVLREHASDVLESAEVIGSNILASYLHDAHARLERFDQAGKSRAPIPLPMLGASDGFSGLEDGGEAFFHFESFAAPPSIQRVELSTGELSVWEKIDSPIRSQDYLVTPHRAVSKDNTQVPYLVVRRRDSNRKQTPSPTVLYGYGGFNVSLEPRFSRPNCALLEQGATYVQANLRGGGELGEAWHRAGQLDKKQNVFDDFIAVAEDLLRRRVTTPAQLAIMGRSNGGLLVAAAVTQRPELFSAAVSSVPLTDMLRYERFLIAKLWSPEYGSADDKQQFHWLLRYSPYHRVKPGVAYPAVLFTTAASDTRVDPLHARKMTAALQHATRSEKPILLRTEIEAGHGAGKPTRKIADEFADIFAFTLWQLGQYPDAGN